jgi:small subunit ribosomal protein S15
MPKSKKTKILEKPVWLKYTPEEVEAIILKLANKGLTSEKIGLTLRDQYGIPKVKLLGLKIKTVLEKKEKFIEPTAINLKNKIDKINKHYEKHTHDRKAERSLIITKAKFKKREDYDLNHMK